MDLRTWVGRYLRHNEAQRPGFIVTNDLWNTLWNLINEQGDYNTETIQQVITEFLAEKERTESMLLSTNIKAGMNVSVTMNANTNDVIINAMGSGEAPPGFPNSEMVTEMINNAVVQFNTDIVQVLGNDMQNQIDGKINTYSQADDPALAWTDAATQAKHVGDLWYNITLQKTYRWGGLVWDMLTDQDAIDAKTLAESKIQFFTTEPTTPYYKGDLWNSVDGLLKFCNATKTTGTYSESDWSLAYQAVLDSLVGQADRITLTESAITQANDAIDARVTKTEYTDYIVATTLRIEQAEQKITPEAIMSVVNQTLTAQYLDKVSTETMIQTKVDQSAEGIISTVSEQVATKSKVFTTQPAPPYAIGDLWAQGSGDLMRCNTARTTGDYTASDWGPATNYTDDTVANAKNKVFVLAGTTTPTNYKVGDLWVLQSATVYTNKKTGTVLTANTASATYSAAHWADQITSSTITQAQTAITLAFQTGGLSTQVEFGTFGEVIYNGAFEIYDKPKTDATKKKVFGIDNTTGDVFMLGKITNIDKTIAAQIGQVDITLGGIPYTAKGLGVYKNGILAGMIYCDYTGGLSFQSTGTNLSFSCGGDATSPNFKMDKNGFEIDIPPIPDDQGNITEPYATCTADKYGRVQIGAADGNGLDIVSDTGILKLRGGNNTLYMGPDGIEFTSNGTSLSSLFCVRPTGDISSLGNHLVKSPNISRIVDQTAGSNANNAKYMHIEIDGVGALGIFYDISDAKLKKNIQPVKPTEKTGLSLIKQIELVEFDFKDTKKHIDIGIIAQQLEGLNKQMVIKVEQPENSPYYDETGEDNYIRQPNTYQLVVNLIMAMQEQQALINNLTSEITDIKQELQNLKG